MKFTITTSMLQALVSKAIKGAGFNKLLPITSMIGIDDNGALNLYTTDGTNNLKISGDVIVSDGFDITLEADTFAKLVSKLTSDTVMLEVKDNTLIITGNGTYKLPLQMSDDGSPLIFPNKPDNESAFESIGTLPATAIEVMLNSLKPSLSNNVSSPHSKYFVGEFLASTDRFMLCAYSGVSFDTDMLFSREFVDLLGVAGGDVELWLTDDYIIAVAEGFVLRTKLSGNPDEFNIKGLKKMLNFKLDSYCKVNKKSLLSLLDRLSLFVGEYDDGAIIVHFTENGMEISSLKSDGVETVDYMEFSNFTDLTIKINITRLIVLLKGYLSDSVDIHYGSDACIKLTDGNTTEVLALMK